MSCRATGKSRRHANSEFPQSACVPDAAGHSSRGGTGTIRRCDDGASAPADLSTGFGYGAYSRRRISESRGRGLRSRRPCSPGARAEGLASGMLERKAARSSALLAATLFERRFAGDRPGIGPRTLDLDDVVQALLALLVRPEDVPDIFHRRAILGLGRGEIAAHEIFGLVGLGDDDIAGLGLALRTAARNPRRRRPARPRWKRSRRSRPRD